jgi:hypothetical protein
MKLFYKIEKKCGGSFWSNSYVFILSILYFRLVKWDAKHMILVF